MSAGLVVALVIVALVVGLFAGALVRDVFLTVWGAWLLFWDGAAYAGRRIVFAAGVLALVAAAGAVAWHVVK